MANAARALGRSYGALFFSCFGACWLLLSAYAFGELKAFAMIGTCLGLLAFFWICLSTLRRAKQLGGDEPESDERKRDDRLFGVVNAVQWVVVFLIFTFFPKLGYGDFAIPAVLLVVGLHFFALPRSYRYRSNLVTGMALTVWAIACPLLFKGDRMIGFVALGGGVVLWCSAAWALRMANGYLQDGAGHES